MISLYNSTALYYRRIRALNRDACGLLLRLADIKLLVSSSQFSAALDAIAARLNSRPRKTLGFAKPDEVFAALVNKAANAVTIRNGRGVATELESAQAIYRVHH